MKKTFRKGGIHPPQNKFADTAIKLHPLPVTACLPLSQHIGAPAVPVVAKGDKVQRGALIAEAPKFISASLHAPISGTVAAIEQVVMPNGKPSPAIIIKATQEEHIADTAARKAYWAHIAAANAAPETAPLPSGKEIADCIMQSGIVGLGGATFPSHVKIAHKPGAEAEVLILNGCECEPCLMCDDAVMSTYPSLIVRGAELLLKASGIPRAVIAMEDNKPAAARAIARAIPSGSPVSLEILRTKYPQGGEKQLVEAVTGRRIASGALPASVGAVVNNVATALSVWQAVNTGMPLIERVVTVSGDIPDAERCNYIVAIGTPLSELPFTFPAQGRAILGGPMMGRTAVNLDGPVTKGTSGLTILEGLGRRPVQPCVRCAFCVDACPMGLEPYLLATYGRLRRFDEARDAGVADCLECGACSYSCPSSRPILDFIRLAKQRSRR